MNLKKISLITISAGIVGLLIGLNLDTSVETSYGSSRVHNIGLMHQQQNFLLISALLTVVGIILFAVDKTARSENVPSTTSLSKPLYPKERNCPFCAETIKSQAILCRYCGKTIEPLPNNFEPIETNGIDARNKPDSNAKVDSAASINVSASSEIDKGTDLDELWEKFKRFWV